MKEKSETNLRGLNRTVTSTLSAAVSDLSWASLSPVLLLLADFRSPDVLRDLSRLNRGIPLPNGLTGFLELDPGLGMRLSAGLLFFLPRDACRSTGDCIVVVAKLDEARCLAHCKLH